MAFDNNFNYNSIQSMVLYGSIAALFVFPLIHSAYERLKTKKESSKRGLDNFESEFLSGLMINQSILAVNAPTLQNSDTDPQFQRRLREELSLRHNCVVGGFRTLNTIQESRGRTPNREVLEALTNYQSAYREAVEYRSSAV